MTTTTTKGVSGRRRLARQRLAPVRARAPVGARRARTRPPAAARRPALSQAGQAGLRPCGRFFDSFRLFHVGGGAGQILLGRSHAPLHLSRCWHPSPQRQPRGRTLCSCRPAAAMSKKVDVSFMKFVATDAEWTKEVAEGGSKVLCSA